MSAVQPVPFYALENVWDPEKGFGLASLLLVDREIDDIPPVPSSPVCSPPASPFLRALSPSIGDACLSKGVLGAPKRERLSSPEAMPLLANPGMSYAVPTLKSQSMLTCCLNQNSRQRSVVRRSQKACLSSPNHWSSITSFTRLLSSTPKAVPSSRH